PSPVDSGDRLPTEEPCAFGYLDSKGFSSSKDVTLCLLPSGALMKIAPSWNSLTETLEPLKPVLALQTDILASMLANLTRIGLVTLVQSSPAVSAMPWKMRALRRLLVSILSSCREHSPIWRRSSPSILMTSSRKARNSSATFATVSLAGPAVWICASSALIFFIKLSSSDFCADNTSASWDIVQCLCFFG
ncbi:hypothetical protein HW555_006710, partial [Spodoptera exigua]